jgi:hypothetical protein
MAARQDGRVAIPCPEILRSTAAAALAEPAGRCGHKQVMGAVHDLLAVCSCGLAQLLHPFLLDAKYELAGGLPALCGCVAFQD